MYEAFRYYELYMGKYGRIMKETGLKWDLELGPVDLDVTNLRKMKRFNSLFPKRDLVRLELSWTHYRLLCKLDSKATLGCSEMS